MRVIYSITNRTTSAFRGVIMLLMGMALLIWPASMLNIIVKVIAAFLIAIGVVTLFANIRAEREEVQEMGPDRKRQRDILRAFASLNVSIYLFFGLLIFIFPGFFVSILVFLFGAILLFLGLGQLINLFISNRHASLPIFFYIVPIVITLCGVILFFQPFTAKDVLTMFFGGCLVVYGVEELIAAWMLRKVKFGKDGKFVPAAVEEIPFEEVEEEE
ncbi:MAG: DUF308 domain-containing protein [Bacteroidales bacterium]|nr:DUF308 domain-containing protein [Bacteroidales bacterium]